MEREQHNCYLCKNLYFVCYKNVRFLFMLPYVIFTRLPAMTNTVALKAQTL